MRKGAKSFFRKEKIELASRRVETILRIAALEAHKRKKCGTRISCAHDKMILNRRSDFCENAMMARIKDTYHSIWAKSVRPMIMYLIYSLLVRFEALELPIDK